MAKKRVCCVFGFAPEYRNGIYHLMDADKDIEFDFYFGNASFGGIKLMNIRDMSNVKGVLENRYVRGEKLVWQRGWWHTLNKKYDAYILTGNPGIRSNWLITLAARIMGKPVYLWSHGLYGYEKGFQLFKNYTYFRLAGNMLLYGNHGRSELIKHGYDADKLTVIYNSLDHERFVQLRAKQPDPTLFRNYFGNDDPVIVFVGRLTESKRIDMLINTMKELQEGAARCNLMIIGGGSSESKLTAMAEEMGVEDRVWFYGECYDNEYIATVLKNAVLCVSPGNVGLTAVHAMTFGVPVITHDNMPKQGPEVEIIEADVTGDLYKWGNADDLTRVVEKWVLRMGDKERAASVREKCYEAVERNFTPAAQLRLIKEALLK